MTFPRAVFENFRKCQDKRMNLNEIMWQYVNAHPQVSRESSAFFQEREFLVKQRPYSPDFKQIDQRLNKPLKQNLKKIFYGSPSEDERCSTEKKEKIWARIQQHDSSLQLGS